MIRISIIAYICIAIMLFFPMWLAIKKDSYGDPWWKIFGATLFYDIFWPITLIMAFVVLPIIDWRATRKARKNRWL